jgi:DNA-binding NarL/FixJ family response regulator
VAQGNNYLSPLITDLPADFMASRPQRISITPRQREVLELIGRGLTMKEIAAELNISTRTAESHKYEMMESLGVETTAELIRFSLRVGLIS